MATGLAARVAALTGGAVAQQDIPVGRTRSWLAARLPFLAQPAVFGGSEAAPSLVIGAGRRIAPTVAALRTKGTAVVQILDPKMSLRRFDCVIIPSHDGVSAPNVLQTLGSLGRVSDDLLEAERVHWQPKFSALQRPLMAVLIGGHTKRKTVQDAAWMRLVGDLQALSAETGLVITLSRRTEKGLEARLRDALPDAWIWNGQGDNPYFGMLACADFILVTDDTVNMASEAASAGKPLAIYPLLEEGGKTACFHDALITAGHAERFNGLPGNNATAAPLDETGRIAEKIAGLL